MKHESEGTADYDDWNTVCQILRLRNQEQKLPNGIGFPYTFDIVLGEKMSGNGFPYTFDIVFAENCTSQFGDALPWIFPVTFGGI